MLECGFFAFFIKTTELLDHAAYLTDTSPPLTGKKSKRGRYDPRTVNVTPFCFNFQDFPGSRVQWLGEGGRYAEDNG